MDLSRKIIDASLLSGATMAGIARVDELKKTPSYDGCGGGVWPREVRSVLVVGLFHPVNKPELDWYTGRGGTPGNRMLMRMAKVLELLLKEECDVTARDLPYYVEQGGIFLKDAAVLAGFGSIGRNNLLITPAHGPRVRLRALSLNVELDSTGPIDFRPCDMCSVPCLRVCPHNAFETGNYQREACLKQMGVDEHEGYPLQKVDDAASSHLCIKYCRRCEYTCPVGK